MSLAQHGTMTATMVIKKTPPSIENGQFIPNIASSQNDERLALETQEEYFKLISQVSLKEGFEVFINIVRESSASI